MFKFGQKPVQKRWQSAKISRLVLPTYHSLAVKIFTKPCFAHSFSATKPQVLPFFAQAQFANFTVLGGPTSPLSTHTNKEATSFKKGFII